MGNFDGQLQMLSSNERLHKQPSMTDDQTQMPASTSDSDKQLP